MLNLHTFIAAVLTLSLAGTALEPPSEKPAEPPTAPASSPSQTPTTPATPAALPLSAYAEEKIGGFKVLMHPGIASLPADRQGRLRTVLAYDLETIARTIPPPSLAAVRTITIAINHDAPPRARGACFHPSAGWLVANGLDKEREGCVEILSIDDYLDWRSIQPAMVFHELAHGYHWLLGFGRSDVQGAFDAAVSSRSLYLQVAHTLSQGGPGQKAYALTNAQEYFAELSEAYFLRNDIYPFVRDELLSYDPAGAEVVDRLWKFSDEEISSHMAAAGHPPRAAQSVRP